MDKLHSMRGIIFQDIKWKYRWEVIYGLEEKGSSLRILSTFILQPILSLITLLLDNITY